MPNLRATINAAVAAKGYTVSELARKARMSRPNLSDYLAGKADLTGETLGRLLDALGLKVK